MAECEKQAQSVREVQGIDYATKADFTVVSPVEKEPAKTFRTSKVVNFVNKQVEYMEHQQRTIQGMRREYGIVKADELLMTVILNQTAWFNYTQSLCSEFGIKMPHVLGVTPNM